MDFYLVLNILDQFDQGNFIFIDVENNDTVLFNKINKSGDPIAMVYIYNCVEFFRLLCLKNEIGLGEAYIAKLWSCGDLLLFMTYLVANRKYVLDCINYLPCPEKEVVHVRKLLKGSLSHYLCGLYMDTVITKMNVKPHNRILAICDRSDKIIQYLAEKTNCNVTCAEVVSIYMETNDKYDAIYSIGILEFLERKNYDEFFTFIKRCLDDNGTGSSKCVLHAITRCDVLPISFVSVNLFPDTELPTHNEIVDCVLRNGLQMIFSEQYSHLKAATKNSIQDKTYKSKMSDYCFASCEAAFMANMVNLRHYVLTSSKN